MHSQTSSSLTAAQQQKLAELYQDLQSQYKSTRTKIQAWLISQQAKTAGMKLSSQQALAALSVAGHLALSKPVDVLVMEQVQAIEETQQTEALSAITAEEHQAIMDKMSSFVQMPAGHLERQDELYLEQQLSDLLGFEVTAELEGNRLNHSIGIMGGEQHLKRFPDDTLVQHDAYQESGIAPNRGAFGWFTEQGQLTQKAIDREKYYFAVQTMYLPNWNAEHPRLKEWYKFRKMVVINPQDQKAVVGVVGDAGPALWVKKQFGGSPEIIREAKIWSPKARGRVLLLFVDDPEDKIPLGPIDLQLETLSQKL